MHLELPGFTADVVRWSGCAARLGASQGRPPDFTGESGTPPETYPIIGEKAFLDKPFPSVRRLASQDSRWGLRRSTESEMAETREHSCSRVQVAVESW